MKALKIILLSSLFLLSVAFFSLTPSARLFALSSGTTSPWEVTYIDADENGVYEDHMVCSQNTFTIDDDPADENYTTVWVYEVTGTPELIGNQGTYNTYETDPVNLITFNSICHGSADFPLGATYNIRACAGESGGDTPPEFLEPVCNSDQELVLSAEYPIIPQPEYVEPRWGTKLGMGIALLIGIGLVVVFYKTYKPSGRRS